MSESNKELMLFCSTVIIIMFIIGHVMTYLISSRDQYRMELIRSGYEQRYDQVADAWVWQKSETPHVAEVQEGFDGSR